MTYAGAFGAPTLYNNGPCGLEKTFIDAHVRVKRVPTDMGNKQRRELRLAERYETTRNRAALKGCRFHRDELTLLETGRPHPWDEYNDYLLNGNDLRPKFPELIHSKYDDKYLRGVA